MSLSSSSSGNGGGGNPFADLGDPAPRAGAPSAAAIQLLSIRAHVPTILDFEESNFTIWQTHFNVTFRKLGLVDHINGTVDAQLMVHDVEWTQIDQCIVSWLYTSVSRDILDIIIKPSDTAERAWNALNNLFLDNRLQRAIYAKHEFHNLLQGDLSITAYSSRLKCIADTLRDVGSPVSDQDLLLAFINGLNGQFSHCIAALTINPTGLTFAKARSALLQEERRLARFAQLPAQPTALYAGGAPRTAPVQAPAPAAPVQVPASRPNTPAGNGGRGRYRGKKKSQQAGGASAPTPPGNSPAAAWPLGAYPVSGMFQAWSPASWRAPTSGILGPRPASTPPQAHAAHMAPYSMQYPGMAPSGMAYPGYFPGPSTPQPTAWDQGPLHAALHNLSLQGGSGGGPDWFLDTGASSHLANNPGSSNSGGDSAM